MKCRLKSSRTVTCTVASVTLFAMLGCPIARGQQPPAAFDARDLTGHWDRVSPIESFGNVPGATRQGGDSQREAPFTPAGKARFDANLPGYGPRRQMQRNDPMGRCEPLGLPRHLTAEIIPPHATFEIVQQPGRILQFFEYRHDWREIWMDGRALPAEADAYPKWNGYSVGRWDGDTLVVESLGFDERSWIDKLGYPHSESMRLEERYRRIDAETIELTMTVTDPIVYTAPFVSDLKRFRLNPEKAHAWDEQIFCIPAEEMTYQDLIGTGNVID
jgi:hypothetical protein